MNLVRVDGFRMAEYMGQRPTRDRRGVCADSAARDDHGGGGRDEWWSRDVRGGELVVHQTKSESVGGEEREVSG